MKNILLLFLAGCLTMEGCKKTGNGTSSDTLPPITQTGANTFGCLINGKVYTPKGFDQNHPNFDMIVDPGYYGNLEITTFSESNGLTSKLIINCFGITGINNFYLPKDSIYPFFQTNNCSYNDPLYKFRSGFFKITKYDLINNVISGEFEFKLYDPTISCDTIRITQGRFDKKL
jgi:hypothetical protein